MPTTGGGESVVSLLTGTITASSTLVEVPPAALAGSSNLYTQQSINWSVQNGYLADSADQRYTATLTLSATPTVLDLTNLVDPFGIPIDFARVKSMYIQNLNTTDGQNLKVGYASSTSNAWTSWLSNPGQLILCPSTAASNGGMLFVAPNATGWVVSSTNKLVNLDPGSNTIHCVVEIVGASV